jgi:hypothetical protein
VERLVVAHFLDSFYTVDFRCYDLVVDEVQHALEVVKLRMNRLGVRDLRDVS